MGNRVVIGILIVITLILTGAGFTWFKNNSQSKVSSTESSPSPETTSSPAVEASVTTDTRKSIRDLFATSGNQKCTFSDSQNSSSGTIYTSSGKMRGDFQTVSKGQTLISHMIIEDQTSYIWTDGVSQGMKLSAGKIGSLTGTASNSGSVAETNSTPINVEQKVSYGCVAWTPDQKLLTLPTNIKFSSLSEIMPQIQANESATGSSGLDTKAACQACDKLPSSAREQCKKALSC
jgi:hypothetical protein